MADRLGEAARSFTLIGSATRGLTLSADEP